MTICVRKDELKKTQVHIDFKFCIVKVAFYLFVVAVRDSAPNANPVSDNILIENSRTYQIRLHDHMNYLGSCKHRDRGYKEKTKELAVVGLLCTFVLLHG